MKHKPSCAIYDPCPSQCDCCAPTDYQQGFQAGAASRDAYIEQLELALLQVRKAICGDIHNTDDLLDLIANRDAEIAELVGVLGNVTAHLVAAHSLLSRGGKKAAASDTIFKIMLQDYEKSFEAGRKALAKVRKP